jgi:hypothetical protein
MNQLSPNRHAAACGMMYVLVGWAAGLAVGHAAAPNTRLTGEWVLDATASDNFDAKLNAYIAASQKREHERRRRPRYSDDVERIAGSPEDIPMEETERARDRLIEAFRPAARLSVAVDADSLSLTADATPARRYALDETTTRMDGSGMATIAARWTGAALVIRSRFTNRALHVQQLTLDRTGNKLQLLLQVKDPMAVQLQVASTYRRQ